MVSSTKTFAEQVTKENSSLKQRLQKAEAYIQWIIQGKDFSLLSPTDLDKWQSIYTEGLKQIAAERGKREAFEEYKDLQKEFEKIYLLNQNLQSKINGIKDNVYLKESLELGPIEPNYEKSENKQGKSFY